jgi:leucyl-tRNA synthetase
MKTLPIYDHSKIESKWQKKWESSKIYKTKEDPKRSKYYILDMFPYPSGEGLHVGHPKGYIATDIVSRYQRMNGRSVLHPMGFDAFGLPAENYAIKTKTNPEIAVKKNVQRYKDQLQMLGFDYDWSREVNTTDPKYYKWTQWIFLQMFKKGLAYESFEPINWCPSCKTGLANEDVENGHCERCGTLVEKKPMRQWVLKITDYAERLLKDLDVKKGGAGADASMPLLDWPASIVKLQKDWIGRSQGALIKFDIADCKLKKDIEVFTTRPDTLFGVTYVVLAPEHRLVSEILSAVENPKEVEAYIARAKNETEIERTDATKEKTGVELKGISVINPANKEKVPVWISDYVLVDYGTGAVMAVPAHDDRDFAFAKKFGLNIIEVISGGNVNGKAYLEEGLMINSRQFNGKSSDSIFKEITSFVGGKWVNKYKLRDWVFSRQRYWGEPIPVVHCEKCGVVPVPEKDLPVKLPSVKSYEPTGTGESPLAAIEKWVNTKCPKCSGKAKRETNTMPQWAGSSWYYLRYEDPKNTKALVGLKNEKYWSPIDLYVGGAEHATRHLIYSRFWHKFLYDIGVVSTIEPFIKLQHVGLIMGEDGRKMGKRFGNVVNPDDVVRTYGADTLRVYEMFMGPFDQQISWSTDSMVGSRRFIEKVWRLGMRVIEGRETEFSKDRGLPVGANPSEGRVFATSADLEKTSVSRIIHKTIKKVSGDIQSLNFNTAISSLMIAVNEIEKIISSQDGVGISRDQFESLLKLLAPFAPHMTDELWTTLGNKKSIHISEWPKYDPALVVESTAKIMVQVNGKVRGSFEIAINSDDEALKNTALGLTEVKKWVDGEEIKKVIIIKGKLVSIVI